jgi:hypothetical protein
MRHPKEWVDIGRTKHFAAIFRHTPCGATRNIMPSRLSNEKWRCITCDRNSKIGIKSSNGLHVVIGYDTESRYNVECIKCGFVHSSKVTNLPTQCMNGCHNLVYVGKQFGHWKVLSVGRTVHDDTISICGICGEQGTPTLHNLLDGNSTGHASCVRRFNNRNKK